MNVGCYLFGASLSVLASAVGAQTTSANPKPPSLAAEPEAATPAQDPTSNVSATGRTDAAAASSGSEPALGDIIVTARRRNENIQDVPISITAVSGQALATRGVRDAIDLQYQTPSLTVTANGASRSSVSYAIRGQRTQEAQLLTDPPVGTYFAEVVEPRTYGFGTTFYDIQNVQVLKGVQGTLFGRNMTGGAVLVEPNHPDLTGVHGDLAGQYGNYNLKDVTGDINLPIVKDVFGIRVAGRYRDRDGFTKDVNSGRDYDDQHFYSFRASAELHLDRLTSYTVFDYVKENEHGTALKLIGYTFTDPINGAPTVIAQQTGASPFFPVAAGQPPQDLAALFNRALSLGRYRVDYGGFGTAADPLDGVDGLPFNRIRNYGITNKTTFKAGPVTFKNIFGYRNIRYVNHTDYDGSPAALIAPVQFSYTHDYSEEFQMQGTPFGSRFELTMGGYYFREAGQDGSFPLTFPQLTSIGFASGAPAASAPFFLGLPASAFQQSNIGHGVATSYAFYAAGTYTLTSAFKLSGGVRYNNDERQAAVNPFYLNLLGTGPICAFNGFGALPLDQCEQKRTLKNEAVTYDGTIQYQPNRDLNAYASIRHGYRAGGFSLRATDDTTFAPFQPEKVEEYEVGLKNAFRLGAARLTTNLAVFYQNYSNVQTQNAVLAGTQIETIVSNIGKRHDYGGEFEANLMLPGGLSANVFYSYAKNKTVAGDVGTYANQGIPKHQLGGGVTYAREVERVGSLIGNVNVAYRSSTPLDEYDAIGIQKGYAIVNGRIGIDDIAGTHFGAALFVTNLTNKYYKQGGIYLESGGPVSAGPGFAASTFGEPRMFGGEVSVKF